MANRWLTVWETSLAELTKKSSRNRESYLSDGQNGRMKSTDLTREQIEAILAKLTPTLGYLTRLSARMDRKGFGDDRLAADVRKAQQAMQDLRMRLHSLSCDGMD
jgi:imidazolonepropionase-like amidohydrolase